MREIEIAPHYDLLDKSSVVSQATKEPSVHLQCGHMTNEESIALLERLDLDSDGFQSRTGNQHRKRETQEGMCTLNISLDRIYRNFSVALTTKYGLLLTIALGVFFCIDLAICLVILRRLSGLQSPQPDELEYRSPYTNLDELYRTGLINASDYPPIVSMPRRSVQVSNIEQTRVFPQDEHRWLSQYGTISPPDRHVMVTSSVKMSAAGQVPGTHTNPYVADSHYCPIPDNGLWDGALRPSVPPSFIEYRSDNDLSQ